MLDTGLFPNRWIKIDKGDFVRVFSPHFSAVKDSRIITNSLLQKQLSLVLNTAGICKLLFLEPKIHWRGFEVSQAVDFFFF